MSEFNYLTGRPELFDSAPADAMVVLEHDDGRLFYAVDHVQGAQYWYDDGSVGARAGLIALYNKTRVVARRVRADGLPPAHPKRDPIPKSRLDRMQQAQNSLKKAVSQPAPVTPKPERKPEPAPVKAEPVDFAKLTDVVDKPSKDEAKAPAPIAAPKADGFVSVFDMAGKKRGGFFGDNPAFITIHVSGNVGLSKPLLMPGDAVDIQINPANGKVRVGKVETGGRELPKSKVFGCRPILKLVKFPEGQKSVRVYLTEAEGWWHGQVDLAEVAK